MNPILNDNEVESYSFDKLGVVMKVFVVCGDPKVAIASNHDPFALDLVAHFLGMVTYHNDNVAPAATAALMPPSQTVQG